MFKGTSVDDLEAWLVSADGDVIQSHEMFSHCEHDS